MRVYYLDVAKGLSILLVVLGHSHVLGKADSDKVNAALSLFRMPFFFFVSGVFLSYQKPFFSYVFYKFNVLVKPFISTILLYVIGKSILSGDLPTLYTIRNMLYGNGVTIGWPWAPMWFLPHLWVVFLFSTVLLKLTKFSDRTLFVRS